MADDIVSDMLDATIPLERFQDASQWDHVDYGVPVFVEHQLWEVPHPWKKGKTVHLAVLPGDDKPKEGTMLYSIGAKELAETAKKINTAFKDRLTPVKVFIGHRDQSKPEAEQPEIVGYGVGAKVGSFGPKNIKAVLLDKLCYVRGKYQEAKTFPERSPEFKPMTGQLTGLALLRNDPKLPMGVMTYKTADTVCYGPDLLDKEEAPPAGKPKPDAGKGDEVPPNIQQKGTPDDPTKPPSIADPDPAEHDRWKEHMDKYKRTDPMMLQMCKDYESKCAAAIAPEEGAPPVGGEGDETEGGDEPPAVPGKGKPPVKDDGENMADEALTVQYKALEAKVDKAIADNGTLAKKVDTLQASNETWQAKYAASEAKRIVTALVHEGYQIKDPKKEMDRMAKLDDAGRKERSQEIRENYAQTEYRRDPSHVPEIETYDGGVEGAEETDPAIADPMDMTAAVKYAEDNKLDMDKDWAKICQAVAARNGKPALKK